METKGRKTLKTVAVATGMAVLVVLMLWMLGVLSGKGVGPDSAVPETAARTPLATAQVEKIMVTDTYEAVGTIRPRTETRIEAQVQGRIVQYAVNAGDEVKEGDLLIALDDQSFRVRLDQARDGLAQARARKEQALEGQAGANAVFTRAQQALERTKKLFSADAATKAQLEEAQAGFRRAEAELARAGQAVNEAESGVSQAQKAIHQAQIALAYTRILAPKDGQVVKRLAEPGDLAFPGKPLLLLQTRGALRLEAVVREGLMSRVPVGTHVKVAVGALDTTLEGTVDERVPSADPATRTFLVKVALPDYPGLYPGMFGRLILPLDAQEVVAAPRKFIYRIGQLDMVYVKEGSAWRRIFVKTGRTLENGDVEILSGLGGGETLGLFEETNG